MPEISRFHWADYLVLGVFMVMSALIGVFIGFKDRKKMTSKNFFTGGGDMHWALVAFSMQASFVSSIFLLSMPVEIYAWGSMYYYLFLAYLIGITFSGFFVMPVFYELQLISAYEYLEIRFNKAVRTACSLCFFLQTFLYMSVVLYSPALALAQVSGLSVSVSIIVCGLVCTFYTVSGGLKATVWNDFIQIIIIAVALVTLVALSLWKIGGFNRMWQINIKGDRIDFDDFRVDPRLRTTFWTQVVGGFFVNLSMFASNQTSIQKFSGVGTLRGAKKASVLCCISIVLLFTLVCLTGLGSHALYSDCDPLIEGRIRKYDQIIPLFVMDVMGHLPGLPGLFIAAVLSAGLSSLSGNLNALTAVTLTDFVNPLHRKFKGHYLNERILALLSRGLTLAFGLVIIGMGFAAQYFGEVVVQVAFSIFGFVGGPLTCTVICGMSLPFLNSIGALSGLIMSLLVSSWVAVGAILNKVPRAMLPMGSCGFENITMVTVVSDVVESVAKDSLNAGSIVENIYKISHMYYGLVAFIVFLVIAIPVSLVTGRTKSVESKLIIYWFDQCCCCLPSTFKRCFRCGAELLVKDEDVKSEIATQSVNAFISEFIGKNEMSIQVSFPSDQDLPTLDPPRHDDLNVPDVENYTAVSDDGAGRDDLTAPDKPDTKEDSIFRRTNVTKLHSDSEIDITGL